MENDHACQPITAESVPTVIETARLSLIQMSLNEQDLLFELDQDEAVMRYINGGRKTTMEDIEQRFMPRLRRYHNPLKGYGLWKVIAKAAFVTTESNRVTEERAGQFLGWILVRPMFFFTDNPHLHDIELGWRFKQSTWGKGIATEAAKAVADLVTNHTEVTSLSAIADEDNTGSINIMKKLGMTFVKKQAHPDVPDNQQVVFYRLSLNK
ncbi:GNAT family N-acetyltransferase [Shewanella glacialimarina]|jgi:RimJ/RimL family protein N-acetyltransferase|uniref:GNAT family N-acetyltransferase n=1 Tax=Shewanella glacialimarina TaxID=2590884 RepID=UPI001CF841F7|nr:GNAT family N-acetyltransferase [Shewanella glacialimarina]UCX04845.1 GNAT family N-acetyltransferase [Shewanella glacialimarina]